MGTRADAAVAPDFSVYNPEYLYGFVFFRQQRDASLRRGYLQVAIYLACLALGFIHAFDMLDVDRSFDCSIDCLELIKRRWCI